MTNDGRTTEMVYVDQLELRQEFRPGVLADIATTTNITLHGRSTDQWYRRHPQGLDSDRRLVWRSVAGGTPAPASVVRALDAAGR